MGLCCYCDQPVELASAFYAGNPIHPDCEIAFRAEMDAAFPDEDGDVEEVDTDLYEDDGQPLGV